jgi:hypothetical protein
MRCEALDFIPVKLGLARFLGISGVEALPSYMFSYRHAFHAGNHADVIKHLTLIATLQHLAAKRGWHHHHRHPCGCGSLQA